MYTWIVFDALAGGASPQSSSIRWSVETTSFACSSRTASTDRCFTPPSESGRSRSATSRGPSSLKFMGL